MRGFNHKWPEQDFHCSWVVFQSEMEVKKLTSVEDYLYRELKRNTPYYAEQLRYRQKILSSPFGSHISLNTSTERRGHWRSGHLMLSFLA